MNFSNFSSCLIYICNLIRVLMMNRAKRGGGSLKGFDTAEFLIENCKCTCVAVQKKGKSAGYLLNTKTYRNFWLLA